ncbi:MAG: hypothetical protein CW338_11240 [Clostridiales bacterium]|nr:hypothetical protein [Clostridiales bacterium]
MYDDEFDDEKTPYENDDKPVKGKPGAAITCMILGICSVSIWESPFITSIPCLIMGIIAVTMANRLQESTDVRFHGFLKAGRITGIIGIIISALYTLIMTLSFAGMCN